ncbi:MAG TPA: hypothetical protein VG456_19680 [Candidatus Sulfopaludibacter sp.]|jgi:hypothetical protein|nr:hypothetical protein [Candidatus Sulfopaludibacter sp.]
MRQTAWNLLTGSTGALILSAAARALPDPVGGGSRLYLWMFRFVHYVLANFDKAGGGNESQPSRN